MNVSRLFEKARAYELNSMSDYELDIFRALTAVCDMSPQLKKVYNMLMDEKLLHGNRVDDVALLNEFSNNFHMISEVLDNDGDEVEFNSLFKPVITEEGLCYTFNMLDESDLYKKSTVADIRLPKGLPKSNWTSYGYDKSESASAYPARVLGAGLNAGILIDLRMRSKDVDYSCKRGISGFRLMLHTPDEVPQAGTHFYQIPFGFKTSMSIHPRVMSTSTNLAHYTPEKRQCNFPKDANLLFFKIYSQANCKRECISGKAD